MLHTRALYNHLALKKQQDPSLDVDEWAVENLRISQTDELFKRLKSFGSNFETETFLEFSSHVDTPEELCDLLFPDEQPDEKKDPFYLIIFELWRRLLPEKQSLSVFCDELDFRIGMYREEALEADEMIQDAIGNLIEILDENADSGLDPEDVFKAVEEYLAHNLEDFILDYIFELLDVENDLYAAELFEAFAPYLEKDNWFDLLKIRILANTDIGAANQELEAFLMRPLDLDVMLEVIYFLSTRGDHDLFKKAVKKALPFTQTHNDLIEVLSLIADYYRRLDEDEKEKAVQQLIEKQEKRKLELADLQILKTFLS